MKKHLFILLTVLCMAFGVRAQEITIGDGTSTVSSMAFFANYMDSWCECTFLASELNASGNILSISLHANGNAFSCEEVNIYMGHRTADNYNNSTSFTPASNLTLVYSATSTTIGSIDGWEEYQFQTPFEYNGTDNLVVVFAKHATSYLSALKYYYTESGSQYRCLYRRADNNIAYSQHPGSASGTTSNRRPNVKLLFGNSDCIQPLGVQASEYTDEGCTISWLSTENGYHYLYQLKEAGDPWSSATTQGTYDTSVTLTNLSPTTTYDFRVQTDCGDTVSTWVDLSFTTLQVPATLPYSCDFNDPNENAMWQFSSSDFNHWAIGSGTSFVNDGNDNALYVSNDFAGTYAADSLLGSYLFAERIIDFGETPGTYDISFDWKCSGYAQGSSLYGGVALFVLDADVATATEFPSYMSESLVFGAQLNDWTHITSQLTDISGYKKLQFFTWGYSFPEARTVPAAVDNISIHESGCVTPTMTFEPGAQSVVITHDGPADGVYLLQYRISGTTTMMDTTFTGSTFTLDNLQMNTAYVAWISQICGSDTSAVSSGVTFSTTCGTAVVTNSTPWMETFTNYPDCWNLATSSDTWTYYPEGFIRHPYGNYTSDVITPVIDISAVTYPCVKFDERRPDYGNSGMGDHLEVYFRTLDEYDTAAWVLLGSYTDVTSTFRTDSLLLPTGLSLIQLRFAALGMGNDADGCSLDNVKVYNMTNPPACMPPIALNTSNITTTSAELSWMMVTSGDVVLYYKSASDLDYTAVTDVVASDGMYLLENLTAGTDYQWYLTLICNGDPIPTAVASFTTACGTLPLPYLQNFDSTEPYTIPNCWNQINPYAGHPQVNDGYAHSADNALKFMCNPNGNAPIYAVLPEFDADFSELQINFWTRRESSNSGTLSVGYVTDLTDASTFVPLMYISSSEIGDDDYHNYLVKFDSVVTDDTLHYYITFKYGQNTSWYWFVDDIQVTVIPPCMEPSSLSATNITISGADLSWTDVANEYAVFYRAEGDSLYTEVNGVTLTNGVYTLDGLAAGTRYEWYVASICDDGTVAAAFNTLYFVTQCHSLSQFPVTWDFESNLYGGTTSYPLPLCWSRIGAGPNARYPYVATSLNNAFSGSHYLTIYNMYSGSYGVLPELDANVLSVQDAILTFYAKATFSSPAMLEVGVMDDPTDASTFTPVQTITLDLAYPVEPYEVLFYTYTGNGQHIAFRNVSPSDVTASFYLDDVTIDVAPPCARPQNLTATASTSNSVTLSWVAAPGQTEWEIAYGNFGFNPNNTAQVVTATSNPFTVTGLQEATTYQFYVRGVCSSEVSSWSLSTSGATECGTTDLPYVEDFEAYQGTTYTDNHGTAPTCWTTYGTNTVYGAPHITSGGDYHYANSGSNSMVFTSGSAGSESYAVLPTFSNDLNTLRLTFWCAMESAFHGTMTVGYVTDLTLIGASFVPVDTIPAVSPSQATTFTIDFTGVDIPAAGNICFRWSYPESYYSCCIDDIEVISIGTPQPDPCNVPTGLHATSVENESISVAWDADSNVSNWYLRHRPENGTWSTVTVLTNSHTITGLTPGSTYEIQVQADCGDDNLSEWSGSVTEQTTNVGIGSWLEGCVTLFPNPAKEVVHVQCTMNNVQLTGELSVFDVYGKLLQVIPITSEITPINVSTLADGMYFVRVTTEAGSVTRTFVKKG